MGTLDPEELVWDEYTSEIDTESDRWAATDRGWLYKGGYCIGYYLKYPASEFHGRLCDEVLASVYDSVVSPHEVESKTGHKCLTFPTVGEAKKWMIEQHTDQLVLLM